MTVALWIFLKIFLMIFLSMIETVNLMGFNSYFFGCLLLLFV